MGAIIQYAIVPHRATTVRLGAETLSIGRRSDCHICLDDRSVRRKHAEIFQYKGQYWIRACAGDELVVNGEWVNNHPFRHLAKVRCGDVMLEFFEDEA